SCRLVASKASKKGLEKDKDSFKSRIVYSLDACAEGRDGGAEENGRLENEDKTRLGKMDTRCDHLLIESRFESGNLRAAIQTDKTHYELILLPENQLVTRRGITSSGSILRSQTAKRT
ncbi:hypothetical protein PENTCL1PPCAC_891, partial [Pristionchus entomophagus]